MSKRHFDKCLKTDLRYGTQPGQSRIYLLPYTGYLTDVKFETLADLLVQRAPHIFTPDFDPKSAREAVVLRLKSEWLTGREKNVTVEKDELGTYTLKSEGCWFCFGYKADHFVIVE